MKIGDTIYQNVATSTGNRPRWEPREIYGETKQSWLAGPSWARNHPSQTWTRVPKNPRSNRRRDDWAYTEAECGCITWAAENQYKISERVRMLSRRDHVKLRRIQAVLDWEEGRPWPRLSMKGTDDDR